jgi:hypothetical protein
MSTITIRGLTAAALALAASTACSAAPKSGETLIESIRTYNDGLRWQRFAAAAGRLPLAERSAFVDEWDERSNDLKITDYEIVDLVARGDTAQVQVKISWYGDREGTLHDTHARQTWQRRGKIWFLTDEVRMRGTEMPGLAEPAAPGPPKDSEAPKIVDAPETVDPSGDGGAALGEALPSTISDEDSPATQVRATATSRLPSPGSLR